MHNKAKAFFVDLWEGVMWEVRKFTVARGRFRVLFSGSLLAAADFLKKVSSPKRVHYFLAYVGDGTEGV